MANADRPRGFEPYGEAQGSPVKRIAGEQIRKGEFVVIASDGLMDVITNTTVVRGLAMNDAALNEIVMVLEARNQLYVGQVQDSAFNVQTDCGLLVDVLATGEDAVYNSARMEVNGSTIQTTTGQLELIALKTADDNAFGEFADVVVRINEWQGDNTAAADYAGI